MITDEAVYIGNQRMLNCTFDQDTDNSQGFISSEAYKNNK